MNKQSKPEIIDDYIVELDTPWVAETIDEVFDGAPELLSDNAVIFGGAIRDVIANMPLYGDLDIAVTEYEVGRISNTFSDSPKWIKFDSSMPKKSRVLKPMTNKKSPGPSSTPILKSNMTLSLRSKDYKNVPIKNMISFYTSDNHKAQILIVPYPKKVKDDSILNYLDVSMLLARQVDIRCCGVVMTKNGRVYEVVEGAYKDCIDKVLRIHYINADTDLNRLQQRIQKLTERGWKSEINIKEVGKKVNKLKAIEAAKEKVRAAKEEKLIALNNQAAQESKDKLLNYLDYTSLKSNSDSHVLACNKNLVNNLDGGKALFNIILDKLVKQYKSSILDITYDSIYTYYTITPLNNAANFMKSFYDEIKRIIQKSNFHPDSKFDKTKSLASQHLNTMYDNSYTRFKTNTYLSSDNMQQPTVEPAEDTITRAAPTALYSMNIEVDTTTGSVMTKTPVKFTKPIKSTQKYSRITGDV